MYFSVKMCTQILVQGIKERDASRMFIPGLGTRLQRPRVYDLHPVRTEGLEAEAANKQRLQFGMSNALFARRGVREGSGEVREA